MNQKEYHIIILSQLRFFIAWPIVLCVNFSLTDFLPKINNDFIFILKTFTVFAISFYIAYLIGKAKIKILMTDEGFFHIWERKFLLSFEQNIKISWDLIKDYVIEEHRYIDCFTINLNINKRYKISRLSNPFIKDDYDKFLDDFPQISNRFKGNMNQSNKSPIVKGLSFYESKEFKWFIYFIILAIILILIAFNL